MNIRFAKVAAIVFCASCAALSATSCGADVKTPEPNAVGPTPVVTATAADDAPAMLDSCNEKSEIESCTKSCEADEPDACESLGHLLYRVCHSSPKPEDCEPYLAAITGNEKVETNPKGRRDRFKFACEKDLADCRKYLPGGMHRQREEDRGFDLYSMGCLSAKLQESVDTAAADSCNRYGKALWEGTHGLTPNKKLGIQYRAKDCGDTEVNSDACIFVGNCYESGESVEKSDDLALLYWARGCAGYVGEDACDFLGDRFDAGTLQGSSLTQVASELDKGCNTPGFGGRPRAPEACVILGEIQSAKDPEAAKALFAKAYKALDDGCNGKYPEMLTCAELAHMKRSGIGMAVDKPGAAALYKRACESNVPRGCYGLAMLTRAGDGVKKDEAAAATLFKKACDKGHEAACNELKK